MEKANNHADEELKALKDQIPFLHWGRLRFIGSIRVLSLIPFVGAGVVSILNLPQFSEVNVKKILEDLWTISSMFTFLVSLFAANVMYHIFCPAMIKKFESLGDLYQQQLTIKQNQKSVYPDDKFDADLKHVSQTYVENLASLWLARWCSFVLFILSLIFMFYFLYKFRLVLIYP